MSTKTIGSSNKTMVQIKRHSNKSTYALIIGLIGLAISIIGLFKGLSQSDPRPLLGWLIGFSFWFSILIGSLYFIMLFYLFDSGWSVIVRRQFEHAVSGLKWIALIFSPLLIISLFYDKDPGILWGWLNEEELLKSTEGHGVDVLYQAKSPYLSSCLLYTSPSQRDRGCSRMPSSA